MSIRAVQAVFDNSTLKGSARLVLLAIADNADGDSGEAWPHQAEIARKAGVSERTVKASVAAAVKAGELLVERTKHPKRARHSNIYTVLVPGAARGEICPLDEPKGRNLPPAKCKSRPLQGAKSAPCIYMNEPSLEPSLEPTTEECVSDCSHKRPTFEEFWKLYPKKRGKGAAERKWAKMTPADRVRAVATIEAHAAEKDWRKDGGKYIPYPQKWLGDRRYLDEIATQRADDGWAS